MSAICGGGPKGRAVAECPVCGGRRRAIRTWVFDGYAIDDMCCGCGTLWQDHEQFRSNNGKRARAERAERARTEWRTLPRWRDVIRRELNAALAANEEVKP